MTKKLDHFTRDWNKQIATENRKANTDARRAKKKPMTEHAIQKAILELYGKHGRSRLFRNNCGVMRSGKRYIKYGLCPGSSDIIGWQSVKITKDMVGKRVAVFSAIEVKDAKSAATPAQFEFLRDVFEAGGNARVVRSVEEVPEALEM